MEMVKLNAQVRAGKGKGAAGRTRREGLVPAVVYGLGTDTVSLQFDAKELLQALHGEQGQHAIVDLTVDGQDELNGPAIFREIQRHPIRGDLVHADLVRIDLTKKIDTVVPIHLEGKAPGVEEGGVLDFQCREVDVQCLPTKIPDYFVADISHMTIGDAIQVDVLVAPEGVEILTPPERAICAIHPPRVLKTAEEEAAEAEAAEAEAAEGEEGAEGGEESEEGGED